MPVLKIIIVLGDKTAEIDLIEKTYSGTLPIETTADFLKPFVKDLISCPQKYKTV